MLYIIASVFYLISGLYLLSKNKVGENKNKNNHDDNNNDGNNDSNDGNNDSNDGNNDSNDNKKNIKPNDHDAFFSIIVFIFSITLFLEYLVTKNPNNNHLYSVLLFLMLYLFVALPNLLFFTIFDNFIIKFEFVGILVGLYTLISSYLLFTLNKYNINSGFLPGNLMSWGAIKALTTNHLPFFLFFSFFSAFLLGVLLVNLFISQTILINPVRYVFLFLAGGISSVIVYFTQVKEVGIFNQIFSAYNHFNTFIPLFIFIASFSSVLALLDL